MRAIRSGTFRQRVKLYDIPETSYDSRGQPSQEPSLLGTFWAEVRQMGGGEAERARQVWPTATHQVTMRWLGSSLTLKPSMKLETSDGAMLNVLAANNVERRDRGWILTCEQRVGGSS